MNVGKKHVSDVISLAESWACNENLAKGLAASSTLTQSNKVATWHCKKGHTWEARVYSRLRSGCPYCAGKKACPDNCLATMNPELAAEWHPTKNSSSLTPDTVTRSSHRKAWWLCRQGHSWEALISNRAAGHGCPYCAGQRTLPETSLLAVKPALVEEWHPTKNLCTPDNVLPYSSKKVWWQCRQGHSWQSTINNRSRGNGCPFCAGNKATPETCLATVNPRVAAEWHPVKNTPKRTPYNFGPGSEYKAWWLCSKGHEWKLQVYKRAGRGDGCPYCSGKRVCVDNCLATINPTVAAEWHPTKNPRGASPHSVTAGSDKKIWWQCSAGHEWKTSVQHRTGGTGCPQCAKGSISRISQAWLDSLGIPEEFREYPIKLPGRKRAIKVDGFDPKTNTVYEFLGDFWHGNPDLYDSEDVNPVNRKTYGALHRRTMRRLSSLERSGYSVVFIWEKDFKSDRSI